MADVGSTVFVLLAAVAIVGAAGAVVSRRGRRTAFWLVVTMLGTAGATLALGGAYLAIAVLLVLGAAVPSLVLLGALTMHPAAPPRRLRLVVSALAASAFGGVALWALSTLRLTAATPAVPVDAAVLGRELLAGWPYALGALSLVLLAALVAAASSRGGRTG